MTVHRRIAVSGISSIRWPLAQDIAYLAGEGVGAIGVLSSKVDRDPAAVAREIRDAGLAASCVTAALPAGTMLIGSGEATLAALRPPIALAAALGAPCYFTSGATPPRMPTDLAFDALVAALPPVIEHARASGVRLALEHNNSSTRQNGFVHSLRDAIELSEATGIDVCLEIQNCWTERHLPEMIRDHVGRFAVVQVSDYLTGESAQLNRRVLGDGSIPLEWLLGLLLDAGFAGYFEIETLGPAIEAEGYETAIRRSIDWLNQRLVRWGV